MTSCFTCAEIIGMASVVESLKNRWIAESLNRKKKRFTD
jgi:hypothetical protein